VSAQKRAFLALAIGKPIDADREVRSIQRREDV
jgi:hypothetical protein